MAGQNVALFVGAIEAINVATNIVFDSEDEEIYPEERRLPEVGEAVIELNAMDDLFFKTHMRLKRAAFEYILNQIAPFIAQDNSPSNLTSPQKQLMIALWILGTPDSYRSVCLRFGVSKSTGHGAFLRVINALHRIRSNYIQWPIGQRAIDVRNGFRRMNGLSGVIGAIDGSHIYITGPKEQPAAYVGRKGRHSVILQAVCDHNMLFTHCYAGEVGSVHDARVFRKSAVNKYVNEEAHIYFPNGEYILGDAAYPLSRHLMTPYRNNGHLTEPQNHFNFIHSSTRMVIERSFGHLKGRWRRLINLDMRLVQHIPRVIIASCVLHNLCILQHQDHFELAEQDVQPRLVPLVNNGGQVRAGARYRDQIANNL